MKKVKTFLKDSILGYLAVLLLLFVPPFVSGYYLCTADGCFNITLTIILIFVSVIIDIVVWACLFVVAEEKEDPNKKCSNCRNKGDRCELCARMDLYSPYKGVQK